MWSFFIYAKRSSINSLKILNEKNDFFQNYQVHLIHYEPFRKTKQKKHREM